MSAHKLFHGIASSGVEFRHTEVGFDIDDSPFADDSCFFGFGRQEVPFVLVQVVDWRRWMQPFTASLVFGY